MQDDNAVQISKDEPAYSQAEERNILYRQEWLERKGPNIVVPLDLT